MDVKGAFPNINLSRLILCMAEVGIDGDLVCWVASFLSERKMQIVIDGFRRSAPPRVFGNLFKFVEEEVLSLGVKNSESKFGGRECQDTYRSDLTSN